MSRLLCALSALAFSACATAPQQPSSTSPAQAPAEATPVAPAPQTPAGPAPEETAVLPKRLEAETELKTPSGTTFTLAKGWYLSELPGAMLLEDPERELQVALYEVSAASGEEAIADAWKRLRPEFSRPIFQTSKPPARDPWDEVVQVIYDVPASESRGVVGVARRAGQTWHVALLDGTNAAFGRRGAQLNQALGSLKPAGREEESLAGRKPHPFDAQRKAQLSAFIEEWRPKARVPGVAVVVVQDGKIVFEQGFGERELGTGKKVTPDTGFLIGSVTKSLTSLMMAKLVDEGRFTWDTPVKKVMPSFALGDAEMTDKLAMRHTVCACTGLPRQDMEFLFEYANVTPEHRLAELAKMKPTTGFGETFQYSNALVSAGGYAGARALQQKGSLDAAYRAAMDRLVFGPLGMRATTFDFARAAKREHARPHGSDISLAVHAVPLDYERAVSSVAPAGGAWSTARDMARYIQLELAKGVAPNGKRMVSEAPLLARREPQTKISDKAAYGLALILAQDRKLEIISHGGNTLGMTADLFFIPEANVGAVVLTNLQAANAFTAAIRNRLIELWFDARPRAVDGLSFAVEQTQAALAKERERMTLPPERAWSSQFAGTWRHPSLGQLTFRQQGEQLIVDAGEWKSAVGEYREPDGARVLYVVEPPLMTLKLLPQEEKGQPVLILETAQQRYVFTREASAQR